MSASISPRFRASISLALSARCSGVPCRTTSLAASLARSPLVLSASIAARWVPTRPLVALVLVFVFLLAMSSSTSGWALLPGVGGLYEVRSLFGNADPAPIWGG